MIRGKNKVLQAFLGTLMTWGLTAAGAGLVFIFSTGKFSNQVGHYAFVLFFNILHFRYIFKNCFAKVIKSLWKFSSAS